MTDPLRHFFPIDRLRGLIKDLPDDWLVSPSAGSGDLIIARLEPGGIRHAGVIDLYENVVRYYPDERAGGRK